MKGLRQREASIVHDCGIDERSQLDMIGIFYPTAVAQIEGIRQRGASIGHDCGIDERSQLDMTGIFYPTGSSDTESSDRRHTSARGLNWT
jgi:hypothetical protein